VLCLSLSPLSPSLIVVAPVPVLVESHLRIAAAQWSPDGRLFAVCGALSSASASRARHLSLRHQGVAASDGGGPLVLGENALCFYTANGKVRCSVVVV
jgi:hypothetical protein